MNIGITSSASEDKTLGSTGLQRFETAHPRTGIGVKYKNFVFREVKEANSYIQGDVDFIGSRRLSADICSRCNLG